MLFWSLALVVTLIACAALYYAGAGRRVNATGDAPDTPEIAHLRQQLRDIDADAASGRIAPAEAMAARGELARELLRLKQQPAAAPAETRPRRLLVGAAVAATALLSVGVYAALGRPELPAVPLATRADLPPAEITLEDAVAQIEVQLGKTPDDLRGWSVIAPAYMQLGRFADAATALRRVIELDGATADRETDLGEALMMTNGGSAAGEPLTLFKSAVARDPAHIRARYYIAGEATRAGEFEVAKSEWEALLGLAKGDEAWVPNAQAGLDAALAGLSGGPAGGVDQGTIESMVEGLAARLAEGGGTIEEWTRLVRSRLVLGQTELAQQAYDAARSAYPDASVRTELDVLAADHGLVASN